MTAKPIVLIVDDDEDFRRLLGHRLRMHFEVREAATAEAALATSDAATCDAMLIDVDLPGLDGLTCVEMLRLTHPFLPVYTISSHPVGDHAMNRGSSAFFRKPVDVPLLIETLLSATAQRRR